MYPRTTDTTTKVTISIMFYYTDAFANLTSDIVTYIDHVLDIANQGYINSGLPITVFLLGKRFSEVDFVPQVTRQCVEKATVADVADPGTLGGFLF